MRAVVIHDYEKGANVEEVEIVDGLKPGELIVTGGALFLARLRMA